MSPKRVKEVEDMNDEVRRLKINERERRRMHDLNSAMDENTSERQHLRTIYKCTIKTTKYP